MESARMHHHKRRSSSEQDAPSPSSSTCSSSTESAASEHQDITLPFRFESRPVSPLSEGESARASVRRKLSEEGNFQGQRTQPGGPNDPTQAQAQAQTQSQSQSVQLQSIQSLPRPGTRSATNSLGLSRLNSSSSTTPTKSSMAMRRRASLPKLNLAVANRASPALTLRPSTCTSTAASKLLDAFSATTHPDAQEQFPYANGPIQVSPGLYLGAEHVRSRLCLRFLTLMPLDAAEHYRRRTAPTFQHRRRSQRGQGGV